MKKKRNSRWFVPLRGSYIPRAWQGWLVYIPLIFLAVGVIFAASWSKSGMLERLLMAVSEFVALGVIFHWLAKRLS